MMGQSLDLVARRLKVDAQPTGGLIVGRSDATRCHVAGQYRDVPAARVPAASQDTAPHASDLRPLRSARRARFGLKCVATAG